MRFKPRPPHLTAYNYNLYSAKFNNMNKNIGLVWLREDFRILRNEALVYASQNHKSVCVIYLYKKDTFAKREAQKWWLYKSLKNFKRYFF